MKYCINELTYEDYILLRSSVGWENFSKEQAIQSIKNSLYSVTVIEDNHAIAMGRLLGDGLYYLIVDIVVMPEYQNKGIGSRIIDMLLDYVDINTPIGGRASVQLIAEKGAEDFYIRKGFKTIPHEFCGSALRKIYRK